MDEQRIVHLLLDWYALHFRPLPWRQYPTPYRVWISEIMLQQTRIEAVLPYYERFMEALPDVPALAAVSEERLLKLWEGLGYYSRARNLQRAARILVDEHDGQLPADLDRLLSLPGIGPYTAGAIASIAFGIPAPAVDGNAMRVLARLTGDDTDVLTTTGKRRFTDLAWRLIPEQQPGRFNQAIMELGETVCLPNGNPHCEHCPLSALCTAHRDGMQNRLPVRTGKRARRIEKRLVAVVRVPSSPPAVLLHKRSDSGLLAGLWELPNCLADQPQSLMPGIECRLVSELGECKHLFSHVEWHMTGQLYEASPMICLPAEYRMVTLEELQSSYALPSAFRNYAALLPQLLKKEC